MVEVSVMQQKNREWFGGMGEMVEDHDIYKLEASGSPEETPPTGMKLPVPADGLVPLSIEIMNDTEVLGIDVSDKIMSSLIKNAKTDR